MFGQRYTAEATADGTEFRVNAIEVDNQKQYAPAVTILTDGGYAVAYHTVDDNRNNEVLVRLFGADGTGPDEFQVNTYTDSNQSNASVAATPGGIVMAWVSMYQDGDDEGVFARYLDDTIHTDEEDWQVSTQSAYVQSEPAVAASADDGRYVIAWTQTWADDSTVVHLRVFGTPAAE